MKVVVEYMLKFKDITGRDFEELVLDDDLTVGELLTFLKKRYGERFEREFLNPSGDQIGGNVLALLNGESVTDLKTKLKDGDRLTLTYVAFGG